MLIFGGNVIVLVIAVSESSVFAISPVEDLVFVVENDAEVAAGCDSLYVVAFECLDLGGLGYDLGNINSVTSGSSRVHK